MTERTEEMRLPAAGLVGMVALILTVSGSDRIAASERTEVQDEYAHDFWQYLTLDGTVYRHWKPADADLVPAFGPTPGGAYVYANRKLSAEVADYGTVIVAEHRDGDSVTGITAWYRVRPGYNSPTADWYWVHFLPDGTVAQTVADREPFAKRGFVTRVEDGRLWVLRPATTELSGFLKNGEPARHVILPAAGPNRMTLKGPDKETLEAYLAARHGFETVIEDGRVWVFRRGSEAFREFLEKGELAKHVIRPAAGPLGMTVKADDGETLDAYLATLD